MPAAEIERVRLPPERHVGRCEPAHGILGLKQVKDRVVPMLQIPRQELMDNHLGRRVRKEHFDYQGDLRVWITQKATSTVPTAKTARLTQSQPVGGWKRNSIRCDPGWRNTPRMR